MIYEKIASQIMFWTIVVLAWLIFYEFKRSVDGKLRILIMELFLAKVWAYGLAGLYFLFWDFGYFQTTSVLWLRLIVNLPMFWVMIKLYRFIKWGK